MRIEPSLVRVRAVVKAATVSLTVVSNVISRTVNISYIKLRFAIGYFFKYRTLSDSVKIGDVEPYFAEDYVEPGYVSVPFYIAFGKNVTDPIYITETRVLSVSRGASDSVSVSDIFSLAMSGNLYILDPVSVSDDGSLQMQDYCGIDYFAGDYLGDSRAFS